MSAFNQIAMAAHRAGYRAEAVVRILAQQILMLWDGASVEAYIQQSDAPVHAARAAARVLLQVAAT